MSDEEHHKEEEEEEGKKDKPAETGDKEKTDDDDETLTQVSDINEEKSIQKSKVKSKSSIQEDNEQKRKKFFEEELRRLQKSLKTESEKIQAPPVQEHVPYCFNALGPYYDTRTAEHVILKTGDDGKLKNVEPEYATRNTAIGLVDPWVSQHMDHNLAPSVKIRRPQPARQSPKSEKKEKGHRPLGSTMFSTMIPVYPTVEMDTPDLERRKLDYSDVPMLRKELQEKYSSQGKAKIESDYNRTKIDFYRMKLNKIEDVHPINRENMTAAYFAYLQNTPGSKKAVKECVEANRIITTEADEDAGSKHDEQEKTEPDQKEEETTESTDKSEEQSEEQAEDQE